MAYPLFKQARKPEGAEGERLLQSMNEHHGTLAAWGLDHLELAADAHVLDIGCGGGANLERLLDLCPEGLVEGLDHSPVGVKSSLERNGRAVSEGRCIITEGDVLRMPYPDGAFDAAFACESVYFWPDLQRCLAEILRCLSPVGALLIVCEMSDTADPRLEGEEDVITVYDPERLAREVERAGFAEAALHRFSDEAREDREGAARPESARCAEWYCIVAKRTS